MQQKILKTPKTQIHKSEFLNGFLLIEHDRVYALQQLSIPCFSSRLHETLTKAVSVLHANCWNASFMEHSH